MVILKRLFAIKAAILTNKLQFIVKIINQTQMSTKKLTSGHHLCRQASGSALPPFKVVSALPTEHSPSFQAWSSKYPNTDG